MQQMEAAGGIQASINEIAGILGAVAGFVCVGKCIHIGILFLLGTVQDKAKAKDAFIVWFIGAIICAGYLVIGQWVIGLVGSGAGDVLGI